MSQIIGQISFTADGQSGTARSRTGHHAHGTSLVVRPWGLDGAHGHNARLVHNGEDGGDISLKLRRNPGHGFYAVDLHNRTRQREISVGYDLFASAKGGHGEDGGSGGNGEDGQKGHRGIDATQVSDATPGTDGGRGGNGGLGSNGGNGGNGGTVAVRMTESDMHLAYAVQWDVSGGDGGHAGRHGKGGKGGSGGTGGKGITWQEVDGSGMGSTAVTRSYNNNININNNFASLQAGRALDVFIHSGLVSDGITTLPINNIGGRLPASVLPAFIASSNALLTRTTGGDSGDSPVYQTYSRRKAENGRKGANGVTPTTRLFPGNKGRDGIGQFVILNDDGTRSTYRTAFDIVLSNFEICDENDDGVFEPGECLIIQDVQIKNSGEMPTPSRTNIPITMQVPHPLQPVHGHGQATIPRGLGRGETQAAAQRMWARIIPPVDPANHGNMFRDDRSVSLSAIIPDLDRRVRNFDVSRSVRIEYPLGMDLGGFLWLEAMPVGSKGSFRWTIFNRSTKSLGQQSQSQRQVATTISCQPLAPAILGQSSLIVGPRRESRIEHGIDLLETGRSRQVWEQVQIMEEAEEYSRVEFEFVLYATPVTTAFPRSRPQVMDRVTIQRHKLTVQTSNKYGHNPQSAFLMNTSVGISKDLYQAWKGFIQSCTKASADVWNISQHGSFMLENETDSVFSNYQGKSVLSLDYSDFEFCQTPENKVIDFVDPMQIMRLARSGTTFLFLTRNDSKLHKEKTERLRKIVLAAIVDDDPAVIAEAHRYKNTRELLRHLKSGIDSCDACRRLDLRFRLSNAWSARMVARALKKEFPLDYLIVARDEKHILVQNSTSHGQGLMVASVPSHDQRNDLSSLNSAEAFACVRSLPFIKRLDILQESQISSATNHYSEFVVEAAKLSVLHELHQQIQAMSEASRWSDHLLRFRTREFRTTPLHGIVHDKITNTLNHDIMNPPATAGQDSALTGIAEEILVSMILSARCQSVQQLLCRWLIPFKRTRSLFRRSLLKRVRVQIDSTVANQGPVGEEEKKRRFKRFKKNVPQKVLRSNRLAELDERLRTLMNDTVKSFDDILYGLDKAVRTSLYIRPKDVADLRASSDAAKQQRDDSSRQIKDKKRAMGYEETDPVAQPEVSIQRTRVEGMIPENPRNNEPGRQGDAAGVRNGNVEGLANGMAGELPALRELGELEQVDQAHPELHETAVYTVHENLPQSRYRVVNADEVEDREINELDGEAGNVDRQRPGHDMVLVPVELGSGTTSAIEHQTQPGITTLPNRSSESVGDIPDPPEVDISMIAEETVANRAFDTMLTEAILGVVFLTFVGTLNMAGAGGTQI